MYTIWNFSSQKCEQFFRATRSLTSTYSTVVNFSMKYIMSRLKRIESINEIKDELLNLKIDIKFTREKKSTQTVETDFSYFTYDTILNIIQRSFDDAKEMAETVIGMIVNTNLVFEKPLFFNKTNTEKDSVILKNKIIEEEFSADLPCSNSINEINYSDIAKDNISIYQTMSQSLLKNLHFVGYWKNQEIESAVIDCVGLSVTMNVKKKNKSLENISKNKIPPVILSKKRKVNSDEDSSDDNDTLNEKIKYADSPDTESPESSQNENINNKISIQTEKYYAIIYDSGWYIGRILEIIENSCKIKFLKAELDKYKWPKVDDLQLVPQEYIFYGPVSLVVIHSILKDQINLDIINNLQLYVQFKMIPYIHLNNWLNIISTYNILWVLIFQTVEL
ncbi:Uncharacterized protein FWK35_00025479, partial [Aphis craccivora]